MELHILFAAKQILWKNLKVLNYELFRFIEVFEVFQSFSQSTERKSSLSDNMNSRWSHDEIVAGLRYKLSWE